MTIAADELALLREQTAAFIDTDYKELTLVRRTETPNGSGGFEVTETPLVFPQRFRLIPLQGAMTPLRETLDGEAVQPTHILLGEYDVSLARWDKFEDQGHRYQVVWIHAKIAYEQKGEVIYLGEV